MLLTDKHKQILEKVEVLFAEKGFDATTVRDIAEYAGINLAMVSYYFGSKEKLLEAMFYNRMAAAKEKIEDIIVNKSLSFIQKIDMLIDEYINKVMSNQCFHRVMSQAQVTTKNEEITRLIRVFKLGYAKLISTVIAEGQKENKIKKDIDIVLLLTTMTGTSTQMLINKDYYREFNHYKKLSDTAFEELLKDKLSAHIKHLFKATMGYEQ